MEPHLCLYVPPDDTPCPALGEVLDLGEDKSPEHLPSVVTASVLGSLGSGPWPPTIMNISLDRTGGRVVAHVLGKASPDDVFGPRHNDVGARIEKITGASWPHSTLRGAELERLAQPLVDEYARRMRRFGNYPHPRARVLTSFTELRSAATGSFPAFVVAARADARTRENCPRMGGSNIATLAVAMRIVSKLVSPLFSAATTDIFTNADAATIEAFRKAGVDRMAGASLIHEALSPLSKGLEHIVNLLLANEQSAGWGGFFVSSKRMGELLMGCLRATVPEEKHTQEEIRCVIVATVLAWHTVSSFLTALTFLATRHIASLVMRPPGSLDPWGPLVDLMEMGVMVVGHTEPATFSIFARDLS